MKFLFLATACAAAIAAPAHAADADADTILVTAEREGRLQAEAEALARVPGGVALVDAESFADRFAVSFRDTLAFVPGVYTQPRFGEEVRLSIRGSGIGRSFHMRGIQLLIDGAPVNLADGSTDFQELDPLLFDRISVWRGANALRFGGSSLGGAINAATGSGADRPGVGARLEGGSFGAARGLLTLGLADGVGDGLLAISGSREDGWRDHSKRQALRLSGNVGLKLSDTVRTRFHLLGSAIEQEIPGSLTYRQALETPRMAAPAAISGDQSRDIQSIRLVNRTEIDLGTNRLELGGFVNVKDLYHPIFQVVDQDSVDLGLFAKLELNGEIAALPYSVTLGTTARQGDTESRRWINNGGERGAPTYRAALAAKSLESYGEARLTAADGLDLIAGAQWTLADRSVEDRMAPALSDSRSYNEFSPRFGLLWSSGDIQFFANISRSAEIPTFSELVQAPLVGFVPLDPQTAWTYEIGSRGNAGPIGWDISIYRADIRGELLGFTVDPNIPVSTFNAGKTRHQGVELGLEAELASWAKMRASYTYSDFRFVGDAQYGDNRLPVIPEHALRAELRIGTEDWNVAPQLEWVPTGAFADYRNSVRVPGYALLGLSASATVLKNVTVFADARNLLDKRAIGEIAPVVQATGASAIYTPTEARALYLGVRGRF